MIHSPNVHFLHVRFLYHEKCDHNWIYAKDVLTMKSDRLHLHNSIAGRQTHMDRWPDGNVSFHKVLKGTCISSVSMLHIVTHLLDHSRRAAEGYQPAVSLFVL